MVSDLNSVFSNSAKGMKRSAIRELLKLTQRCDIISFAGGLPSPDSFPIEQLKEISCEVLEKEGAQALQYGSTEGDNKLREILVNRYRKDGVDITTNNLVITTASQQALDLIPKIFVNPGDKVICGLPSYLGALSAFSTYGAQMIGIRLDDKGMRADLLEKELEQMKAKGEKPKFIYIIPDFQNPAGITMPESRRLEIIAIARKYDVLIVEDSPYRELRFEGEPQRTMLQLDGTGHVILLGTMSKIFVPGFRMGWVVAHEDVIDKIVMAKQATDLCTSAYLQKIAARYFEKGYFDQNLKKIIDSYRIKRDAMLAAFRKYMPQGVKWTEPEGGLFLFLTLPEHMNAEELFKIAIDQKVAFVLGSVFHCDGSGHNTMRLNFSFMSKEQNEEGVKRLAAAIKQQM
ncbi:MAG: PLP-dependent aminotransferase family protein [Tenuifilaceae bacterium]|jgi:2-aminoadipate transaminase|nr:PLP-dependent aminotransferase family protein [Bacteroidales bacterium]MDI9517650.1 PLP-dependent aminotransferase family protein [Bacteroidota bacterium]NLH55747.1 PLP-dependent aminotransferase family protein [Rikenellaceae bacterium]OQC63407.1 MAG: 2-aminoadipate transaminase [Bacteroidetes bacterium ADurb.Bin008]HNV82442.1 PLP-dependent aminotransferase family protein [Tenuifilaceae bacterium]